MLWDLYWRRRQHWENYQKPLNNYDKKIKVNDVSNNRLIDSKIFNEFNRKVRSKRSLLI